MDIMFTAIMYVAGLNFVLFLIMQRPKCSNNEAMDNIFIKTLYDPWVEEQNKTNSSYYRFTNDTRYHYEFKYEFSSKIKNNDHRLMILLNGRGRICADYWKFAVGRRIISALRASGFSILTICSDSRMFDIYTPIQDNTELKMIYESLQIWINTVYYKSFQCYPRLYIHGISIGSAFATLLSRVLPIQAQILCIHFGQETALTTRSVYPNNMQTRLVLDPTYANWFYFDYCYNAKTRSVRNQSLCPFQSVENQFNAVPPTWYVSFKGDPWLPIKTFRRMQIKIQNDSLNLGGVLLNHKKSVQIDIIHPINVTPTYMQENFDLWHNKPYASRIFFEYLTNFTISNNSKQRGTCRCSSVNFTYWEGFPDITCTWTDKRQAEHRDYIRDVKKFRGTFCEDICGDLVTYHSMGSRNIKKALNWITEIDKLRHSLQIKDYLTRPLRIWMYSKESIINDTQRFLSTKIDWTSISKRYEIYSSEYHLQDYFDRMRSSSSVSRHNLIWTAEPLLADFYIIPSNLMFFYFETHPESLNDTQLSSVYERLNDGYFYKLLMNVHNMFLYSTMTSTASLIGANHVIVLPDIGNIGFLYNKTQQLLSNVIKLTFTGTKQSILSSESKSPSGYENTTVTFKYGYDIVMPPFIILKLNQSVSLNRNMSFTQKKRLFYFAVTINHSSMLQSVHKQLSFLQRDSQQKKQYNKTIEIKGKLYEVISIMSEPVELNEYFHEIQSSVFLFCPETAHPWSSPLYEAMQLGAIPVILTDNIVLPFERFIDWRSFTIKSNIGHVKRMIDSVKRINQFENYAKPKLEKIKSQTNAFQWPYDHIKQNGRDKYVFVPKEDSSGSAKNALHYIALELRCRRLEQFYGLTSDIFSVQSVQAQQLACKSHPKICPCRDKKHSVAFQEYM
ncbi:unnamed protein product [Rotaria socialis]